MEILRKTSGICFAMSETFHLNKGSKFVYIDLIGAFLVLMIRSSIWPCVKKTNMDVSLHSWIKSRKLQFSTKRTQSRTISKSDCTGRDHVVRENLYTPDPRRRNIHQNLELGSMRPKKHGPGPKGNAEKVEKVSSKKGSIMITTI